MRTIVINTGTELLLGDVLNTHLGFIAHQIFPLGLRIDRQVTVPDGSGIGEALTESLHADLVFVTGGLGPTSDDVTREAAAELLGLKLEEDVNVANAIRHRLSSRGWKLTDRILRQALVPMGAVVLSNAYGTAPGLYFRANMNSGVHSPHLFLLPGPPRELQPMFLESVMPILREINPRAVQHEHRTYRIAGMGESLVEEAVGKSILAIPDIELGYCSRPGEVDLRIIGTPVAVAQAESILKTALGNSIFSSGKEELEQVIVHLLTDRNETLATAESCTGGLLAHRLTNVPGASKVFVGGFVVYATEMKVASLGVDESLIGKHGSVSKPVAQAMAEAARARSGAIHALATTGIAGPTGGSEKKPVGTVYIALASENAPTVVRHFNFASDRETFKQLATQAALNLLRERLLL
jgi:nicotinamide-nucleotide amidase